MLRKKERKWNRALSLLLTLAMLLGMLPMMMTGASAAETAVDQAPLVLTASKTELGTTGSATLSVTGGSGDGEVTFKSSNTRLASVEGNVVTATGVGSATITATKAASDGYNEATATVTVHMALTGSGTKADPYLITSDGDFAAFTNGVDAGGMNFSGKYIKQTTDVKSDKA